MVGVCLGWGGPRIIIGEGLGNHPLENLSTGVWTRCELVDCSTEGVDVGIVDALVSRSADWVVFMGVILGNGKPAFSTAAAEDVEVLLPQLELRLPPVYICSSTPRTVNSRVNSSAFIACV